MKFECVKCGNKKEETIIVQYRGCTWSQTYKTTEEHLICKCQRCGYTWTMPTLDNSDEIE